MFVSSWGGQCGLECAIPRVAPTHPGHRLSHLRPTQARSDACALTRSCLAPLQANTKVPCNHHCTARHCIELLCGLFSIGHRTLEAISPGYPPLHSFELLPFHPLQYILKPSSKRVHHSQSRPRCRRRSTQRCPPTLPLHCCPPSRCRLHAPSPTTTTPSGSMLQIH
jgi:hypothetical protein